MTFRVWHLFALVAFAVIAVSGGAAAVVTLSNHQSARTRTVVHVESIALAAAPARDPLQEATDNVREAIPSIETYYADFGGYSGASLAKLRLYDAAVDVKVRYANESTYCVDSTVEGSSAFKAGPTAQVTEGVCPADPLEALKHSDNPGDPAAYPDAAPAAWLTEPDRHERCGTIQGSRGAQIAVFLKRGSVDCAFALNLVDTYLNEPPTAGSGSGDYVNIGHWTCDSRAVGYSDCEGDTGQIEFR